MTPDVVQRAVDDLAERIQRSVVVDDPGVHLLYASRHFGDEDDVRVRAVLQRDAGPQAKAHVLAQGVAAWSGPGVIPPDAAIGMRRRVCVPIRWRGVLLGLLMVMDGDSTLTDAQLAEVAGAARDLAPVLAAREQDEETVVRERTVRDLVDTEAAVRRRAVADLTPLAGRFACVTAVEVALAGPGAAAEAALRDAVRSRGACLSAVSGDSALLLLGSPRPLAADVLHAQTGAVLARARELSGGRTTGRAGIGAPAAGLERAVDSARQAGLARRAAASVLGRDVVAWDELGPWALLLRLPEADREAAALPAEVQRLLAVDPGRELTRTLRTYLDAAGNGPAAAEALHVHRTTLYYRLGRITELTGLDLTDGRTRLTLHLGLTLLDLLDAPER